jgi:hypothetical protein
MSGSSPSLATLISWHAAMRGLKKDGRSPWALTMVVLDMT